MRLLGIGDFARATGLTVPTLRAWADAGVLVPVEVDPGSGYRRYGTSQIAAARLARSLRQLEIPLADLAVLLPQGPQAVADAVCGQAATLAARAGAQQRLAEHLLAALDGPPHGVGARPRLEVALREVAATPVVSLRRAIDVEQLPGWLTTSYAELARHAGAQVAGPPHTVFHAPVDDARAGEVEACLPVTAGGDRVLAGGPAAVVVVTGDDARYPRVLDAYDALSAWALEHGHALGEPPYEVEVGPDRLEVRWPLQR